MDLVDDYEGITGYEEFRNDLRLTHFPTLRRETGELASLEMTPIRIRQRRLEWTAPADARWLAARLTDISRAFGVAATVTPEGRLRYTFTARASR